MSEYVGHKDWFRDKDGNWFHIIINDKGIYINGVLMYFSTVKEKTDD